MRGHNLPKRGRRGIVAGAALLLALTLFAGCSQHLSNAASSPTLERGWNWYHDTLYPFQLAVPSGWKAVAYLNTNSDVGDCKKVVYLLPQAAPVPPDPAQIAQEGEYISITMILNCGPLLIEETGGNTWYPETSTVVVDGTTTRIYDHTAPDGSVERLMAQTFRHSQFIFYLRAPTPLAARDIALYLQVLGSFRY